MAEKIRKAEQEIAPQFAQVYQSVVLLGCESSTSPEEEIHKAYNRMWAGHPDLWERIYLRGIPFSLWVLDPQDRAFFGVIQPARPWNCEYLQIFGGNCQIFPENPYLKGNREAWGRATAPFHPQMLAQAREAQVVE